MHWFLFALWAVMVAYIVASHCFPALCRRVPEWAWRTIVVGQVAVMYAAMWLWTASLG